MLHYNLCRNFQAEVNKYCLNFYNAQKYSYSKKIVTQTQISIATV